MTTDRYLRVRHIVGDPKANPPIPGVLPIGESTWWRLVAEGKAPKPIKLSSRVTVWRENDVLNFVERYASDSGRGRRGGGA